MHTGILASDDGARAGPRRPGRLGQAGCGSGLLCPANVGTAQAITDYVELNVEAEALGFVSNVTVNIPSAAGTRCGDVEMLQTCVAPRTLDCAWVRA